MFIYMPPPHAKETETKTNKKNLGGGNKKLWVLLSALVERFFVSLMRDFGKGYYVLVLVYHYN